MTHIRQWVVNRKRESEREREEPGHAVSKRSLNVSNFVFVIDLALSQMYQKFWEGVIYTRIVSIEFGLLSCDII